MSLSFLENLAIDPSSLGLSAGIIALIFAFLIVLLIVLVILYIYTSLVYMGIAKKAKYSMPGLAWIPIVGPLIVTSGIAKMHWWPILLLIGFWIPFVGWILELVVFVFSIIWLWKTFETIKKPGWWAILCIIPIVNLVLLGIAAWSKK